MNYDEYKNENHDEEENEKNKFGDDIEIDPEILNSLISKLKKMTSDTSVFDSLTLQGNILTVDTLESLRNYCISNPEILHEYSNRETDASIEYDAWIDSINAEKRHMITDSPETCKLTQDYIIDTHRKAMNIFPEVYADYKDVINRITDALEESDIDEAVKNYVEYLWKFRMRNNKYDVLIDLVELYTKMWGLSIVINNELASDDEERPVDSWKAKPNLNPITDEEIKAFNPDDLLRNL
jgi:hypothetical protein